MKSRTDILLEYKPELVKAQEATELLLTPINLDTDSKVVALEEVHTQDVHLIIVSEDLSFFAHEHPQKSGHQYFTNFVFPFAGKFFLYADIKPLNGSPLVVSKTVEVAGENRKEQQYQHSILSNTTDGVVVQLDTQDLSAIKVSIIQKGSIVPATYLGDFLGAKAHVVLINADTKEYLHVHPVVHQDMLVLHSMFPAKGVYRVWIQFLLNGHLYTLDYVLQVTELPKQDHHH